VTLNQFGSIAVAPATATQQSRAAMLADRLRLPFTDIQDMGYPLLLVVTEERLEIRPTGDNLPGPVYVDFTGGALDYRRRFGGGRKQPLGRAVGLKANLTPTVFDATAGLGRDAFILACLGCKVHLFERSPIVGALLEDGLYRGMADPAIGALIRSRMTLTTGDSRELLRELRHGKPEVIYLDPMYPHRAKSALVKKEMRILRALVGDDQDSPDLLRMALQHAQKRVVVKRPKTATSIEGPRPSISISSKNSRFDVYLIVK